MSTSRLFAATNPYFTSARIKKQSPPTKSEGPHWRSGLSSPQTASTDRSNRYDSTRRRPDWVVEELTSRIRADGSTVETATAE
jgi:hypothetical protein